MYYVINEIYRLDKVLIKYMDQVKLYENEFRILDRYKGYLEMIDNLHLSNKDSIRILNLMFKEDEQDILFKESGNYILDKLKQHVMKKYIGM